MSQNLQNEEHVKNTGFYSVTLTILYIVTILYILSSDSRTDLAP